MYTTSQTSSKPKGGSGRRARCQLPHRRLQRRKAALQRRTKELAWWKSEMAIKLFGDTSKAKELIAHKITIATGDIANLTKKTSFV